MYYGLVIGMQWLFSIIRFALAITSNPGHIDIVYARTYVRMYEPRFGFLGKEQALPDRIVGTAARKLYVRLLVTIQHLLLGLGPCPYKCDVSLHVSPMEVKFP